MSTIETPCNLICSIDQKTGFCFGCGRTQGEIGHWINYSPKERSSIIEKLSTRMETIEKKPRRVTRRRKVKSQNTL